MNDQPEIAAEDVRSARALLQWSQIELAKAAEVGVSTIADFERGARTPIGNNISAIRRVFESAGVRFTPAGPTVFTEPSLHIMTATECPELHFRYTLQGATVVQEIFGLFGDVLEGSVDVDAVQAASPHLKASINALVQRHGATAPQLHKLKKLIGTLADGEHFLLLPERPAATADKLRLERYLHRLNHPKETNDDDGLDDLFGQLLERYNMSSPRTDRRTLVGAGGDPQTCRFCMCTAADGATFKKAAHIIPTALGNDHLKSAEECDDCNGYFGRETEPSLIAMLDFQRVFLGTQGRGKNEGRPKLYFGKDSVAHDGKHVSIRSHSVQKNSSDTFQIELGKGALLNPSAVYRALVKIAISIIGAGQLPHLRKTIEWVRYGKNGNRPLPKVASAVVYLPPNPSAQITVYTRLRPDPCLPHIVGEFRLGCYLYVFAVPFSDQDDWDLVGFFDDAAFRDTFRHYIAAGQWVQHDLSRQARVSIMPQLKFVRQSS